MKYDVYYIDYVKDLFLKTFNSFEAADDYRITSIAGEGWDDGDHDEQALRYQIREVADE